MLKSLGKVEMSVDDVAKSDPTYRGWLDVAAKVAPSK